MPEHLRAFIVVMALSAAVFVVIRKPAIEVIGTDVFRRWSAAWVSLTVATFLIPSFWLFLAVAALIVLVVAAREPARPALFLLLLLVAPLVRHAIPGFAGIQRLINLSPQELLAILLLFPVLMNRDRMRPQWQAPRLPDLLFFLYFFVTIVLSLRTTTVTDGVRAAITAFLTMLLPYIVFSRWPRSPGDLRTLAAAFVLPLFVLAPIGVLEMLKGWHLYSAVTANWGGPFGYSYRAGLLRANASTVPIAFGYVFMVGGGLLLLVLGSRPAATSRWGGLAWLGAGLVSALSRGPWVGAAVLALAFITTARRAFQNLVKLGLAGLAAFTIAMATPAADRVLGLIPFVGNIEAENVTYRERLIENSWIVIKRNPLLGSVNWFATPEMQAMIQGEGIIDVVNTYISVALTTGLVGLSLFCGFFLSVLIALWRAIKLLPESEDDLKLAGRALLATLIAILVTIGTVSSVGPIAIIYWTVAGLCVAQTGIIRCRVDEIRKQAKQSRLRRPVLAPSNPEPTPARVEATPAPRRSPTIRNVRNRLGPR